MSEWTPRTPDPCRSDLKAITGDVAAIFFDFDGTLTSVPGEAAQRGRKQADLCKRAPLLAPRLRFLQESGLILGIMSKSCESTILCALQGAGLRDYFNGPIVAKATGFEGKAGFIAELVEKEALGPLGSDGLGRVLLVDDDVRELDRARSHGIQTYAGPAEGGLQEADFDEIEFAVGLGTSLVREEAQPRPAATAGTSPLASDPDCCSTQP